MITPLLSFSTIICFILCVIILFILIAPWAAVLTGKYWRWVEKITRDKR